ncbi:MAG: flagellar basal body P-ring protein FlgI, partial [Planctomycetales bacterium]|nr:flagellar basal body P-ring protein FlgI [Planctomycetales bacterium]
MRPKAFFGGLAPSTCIAFVLAVSLGCSMPHLYTAAPLPQEEPAAPETGPQVIRVADLAGAWGMQAFKVENVALVTGLNNTGSDPPPDPRREMLLGDMRTHDVENPNAVLASTKTSMVMVRALLPPGVRQGDRVDIEVLVPPQSETTSLQGGWLMPTRLTETAVLDGRVHTGHEYVLAQGHVLVDAQLQGSDDPVAWRRGRVLGGGVVLKSRPLGLGVRSEHQ